MILRRAAAPLLGLSMLLAAAPAAAGADVLRQVEAYTPELRRLALDIWRNPELGYLEQSASALLQDALRREGFEVESGIAGMPTAFVARAGRRGRGPVIALLAEMDALPGASQAAEPVRQPVQGQDAGHACGHNLFGPASVAAAVAVRRWLESSGVDGELRVYGTPAEEGGSGKVYMVRAGLFDDVDVVLHWHPDSENSAAQSTSKANVSGKFRFEGVASHASVSPERGRSALDGVEALNFMANLMREHVPEGTRIHYTISDGGGAPNVVPARAEVYYYVRHQDHRVVQDVFARLQRAAEGAAAGTGTTVAWESLGGVYGLLPNDALGRVADAALRQVGGVNYSPADRAFAEAMQAGFERKPPLEQAAAIGPYRADDEWQASTDVGDVSWVVPTVGVRTATWVPGSAAHSWQATAASGHDIGLKGAGVAAGALALTAVQLYREPAVAEAARREFDARRGEGFQYRPLLTRETPPLDYRRPARP